jgi:hypothetical protein
MNRHARLSGALAKAVAAEETRTREAEEQMAELHARLAGLKKKHKNAQAVHAVHTEALKNDLAATVSVLRQHEIQIDPSLIQPINEHATKALTDYGHMARMIYEYLRMAGDQGGSALQVTVHAVTKMKKDFSEEDISNMRYRIRKRMQNMAWLGQLERVPTPVGSSEGRWRLLRRDRDVR